MTCVSCKTGILEHTDFAKIPGELKGTKVLVNMPGLTCPNCGYTTIPGSAMPEYMRLVADAYRKKVGLLTSLEIRSRRKLLGMSQDDFADYLGVGKASVRRWELGQVQEQAMDNLMRLKTDIDAARANYLLVAERLTLSAPALFTQSIGANDTLWRPAPRKYVEAEAWELEPQAA